MSAIMLFEMTQNQTLLLPLLFATIGSVVTSRTLSRDSIYTRKLRQQGVPVDAGLEELTLHKTLVRDIMRSEIERVPVDTTLDAILHRFQETRRDLIYVVEGKMLVGHVHLHDVKGFLNQVDLGPVVIAADVMQRSDSVDPDASIAQVIDHFDDPELEELPVTKMHGDRPILVGRVTRRDLIACINLEVLKRQSLRAKFLVQDQREPSYVELPKGYSLARLPITPLLEGSTIRQSRLREDADLTILTLVEQDASAVACVATGQRRDGEGPTDVAPASRPAQARLRQRAARAPEGVDHRHVERACQVRRLVEPALETSPRVQRHRHGAGGADQELPTDLAQHSAQRPCQRAPPLVLERVEDGAQRALVRAGGPPRRQGPARPRARAVGRSGHDARPACGADAAGRRPFERCGAGGAGRGEQDRQQRIECRRQAGSTDISCRAALPQRRSRP
jgi:CBS domain-containing protein